MPLFGKEDYVELEAEEESKSGKVPIEVEKIVEYSDCGRLQKKLRDGTIMLVNIKQLKNDNMPELKRAVERLKRTADAIGGEIVGAGDDWIIVTPRVGKIVR